MKCATPGRYKRKALTERINKQNESNTKNRENIHRMLSATAIINALCPYSQK